MNISLVVAVSQNGVIGKDGALPWHLPRDMQFFKEITTGHCVLMGRKTYFSIPEAHRPLKNRTNIILSADKTLQIAGCKVCANLQEAIDFAQSQKETELMAIGGAVLFAEIMAKNLADTLYITEIKENITGDVFFPAWQKENYQAKVLLKQEKDEKHAFGFDIVRYDRFATL